MRIKQTKQFLVDKFTKEWIKENKDFLADYNHLCEELLFFKLSWGIEIGFVFKNPKEEKGRELGKGIVEELFEAQKYANKTNQRRITGS